ncbi:MAG: hypothetical protein AB8B79_10000 [Granulosicoccus sp.]
MDIIDRCNAPAKKSMQAATTPFFENDICFSALSSQLNDTHAQESVAKKPRTPISALFLTF